MNSPLANPRVARETLQRFGLQSKYALGQNFLVDDNVVGKILELSRAHEHECVLEVGPGMGTLTCALLNHTGVVAIEKDDDMPAVLAETCATHSDRFALIQADALRVTAAEIEAAAASRHLPQPTALVANLPYAVAATVVLDYFQRLPLLTSQTVMVQTEVAERMQAAPGTKAYGAYSVKLQLIARAAGHFTVPPTCFHPAPHVSSTVIRLEKLHTEEPPALVALACELADAAFAQRRKTIRNSMKSQLPAAQVDALLEACEISPTTRGETLPPRAYLEMARTFRALY